MARSRNGMAVAGLVCGIIGLFILNYILGPLAIIFGAISLRRANAGAARAGMAKAALILGIIDIVVIIILIAVAGVKY